MLQQASSTNNKCSLILQFVSTDRYIIKFSSIWHWRSWLSIISCNFCLFAITSNSCSTIHLHKLVWYIKYCFPLSLLPLVDINKLFISNVGQIQKKCPTIIFVPVKWIDVSTNKLEKWIRWNVGQNKRTSYYKNFNRRIGRNTNSKCK